MASHFASPPVFQLFRCATARCRAPHHHRRLLHCAAAAAQVERAQHQWPGLHEWRASNVDVRRVWGSKGPAAPPLSAAAAAPPNSEAPLPASLAACGRAVLLTADPLAKAELTHRAWRAYKEGALAIGQGKRHCTQRCICGSGMKASTGRRSGPPPSLLPGLLVVQPSPSAACPPAQTSQSWCLHGKSLPWTPPRCPRLVECHAVLLVLLQAIRWVGVRVISCAVP